MLPLFHVKLQYPTVCEVRLVFNSKKIEVLVQMLSWCQTASHVLQGCACITSPAYNPDEDMAEEHQNTYRIMTENFNNVRGCLHSATPIISIVLVLQG